MASGDEAEKKQDIVREEKKVGGEGGEGCGSGVWECEVLGGCVSGVGGGVVSWVRRGQHRCPGHILYGVTADEVNPASTRDSASRVFQRRASVLVKRCW